LWAIPRSAKKHAERFGVFGCGSGARDQSALDPHEELSLCDEQQPLMSAKIASIWPQMSCALQVGVVGGVQHPPCDDSPPLPQDELHLLVEQQSFGGQGLHFGAQGATEQAESRIRCSSASAAATPRRVRREDRNCPLGRSTRKNCEMR
jgi:hypothetical protein